MDKSISTPSLPTTPYLAVIVLFIVLASAALCRCRFCSAILYNSGDKLSVAYHWVGSLFHPSQRLALGSHYSLYVCCNSLPSDVCSTCEGPQHYGVSYPLGRSLVSFWYPGLPKVKRIRPI
ncbi:hypothetical protein F4679DRAFT_228109 [Xylaria curta]|nr:hypothetical protein F4679DRAFT_228109 [Xylaria curta]